MHSRELHEAFSHSVPFHDEGYNVVICYRDNSSLYKATRKIRRTADRICTALQSAVFEGVATTERARHYDGYFITTTDSHLCNKVLAKRRNDAIRRRLASDFEAPLVEIETNEPSIRLDVFNGKGNQQDETWNVTFLDMDALLVADSGPEMQTSSTLAHLKMLHKMHLVLKQYGKRDTNSIVHVKSEALYQVVASIGGCKGVSGLDIERHCKTATGDVTSHITGITIRRLQNKKSASRCPLTIYPPRYIELPTSYDDDCDNTMSIVEICRFHNHDAARGCLRSKKAQQNAKVKGCDLDHKHCKSIYIYTFAS